VAVALALGARMHDLRHDRRPCRVDRIYDGSPRVSLLIGSEARLVRYPWLYAVSG